MKRVRGFPKKIVATLFIFSAFLFVADLAHANDLNPFVKECKESTEYLRNLKMTDPDAGHETAKGEIEIKCGLAYSEAKRRGAEELLQEGYSALFNRERQLALSKFSQAANLGFISGFEALHRNTHVTQNNEVRKTAIENSRLAAELGSPQSSLFYGAHMINQNGGDNVLIEGMKFLWMASSLGESAATFLLSKLYNQETNPKFNKAVATRLLLTAAEQGSSEAAFAWVRSIRGQRNIDFEKINKMMSRIYYYSNLKDISQIIHVYRVLNNTIMKNKYICAVSSISHTGLKPYNTDAPGIVNLSRKQRESIWDVCLRDVN